MDQPPHMSDANKVEIHTMWDDVAAVRAQHRQRSGTSLALKVDTLRRRPQQLESISKTTKDASAASPGTHIVPLPPRKTGGIMLPTTSAHRQVFGQQAKTAAVILALVIAGILALVGWAVVIASAFGTTD